MTSLCFATQAATADEMKALGRAIGRALRVGDVVGLTGALGAGKTTLAQGIAQGLEIPADRHVASPTFALVNQHPARVLFVHADFYRLREEAELRELGLDEIFERAAVVIEWADLFPTALPPDHLEVRIDPSPPTSAESPAESPAGTGARTVTFRPHGPRSIRLISSLFSSTM